MFPGTLGNTSLGLFIFAQPMQLLPIRKFPKITNIRMDLVCFIYIIPSQGPCIPTVDIPFTDRVFVFVPPVFIRTSGLKKQEKVHEEENYPDLERSWLLQPDLSKFL